LIIKNTHYFKDVNLPQWRARGEVKIKSKQHLKITVVKNCLVCIALLCLKYSSQAVVAEDEHWVAPNLTGIH